MNTTLRIIEINSFILYIVDNSHVFKLNHTCKYCQPCVRAKKQNSVLVQLPQQTAQVMVSDGCENLGGAPVVGARALYAANPGLTMHFVSVADNAKGAANLKALAALNPKSLLVDARDIIDTAGYFWHVY